MLQIYLNEDRFQYDIHSLFKEFYPDTDIKMTVREEMQSAPEECGMEYMPSDDVYPTAFIQYDVEENQISLSLLFSDGRKKSLAKSCAYRSGDADNSTNGGATSKETPKNALKQVIYELLSGETGITLPWGNLTGIRPVKIALSMLEQGKDEQEVRNYMQDIFSVSSEKVDLSLKIAKREQKLLTDILVEDGYSIYIGIPFCPTTCLYCSFTSYPIVSWSHIVDQYLDAVEKELDFVAEFYKDKQLDTVYVGGGTPTTLSPQQMTRLLQMLRDKFDLSHLKELTVESGRPDSITREKLRSMKQGGVTRISVNPQTMHDKTLKLIGRRHTVEQFKEAFHLAREEGFDNINMDIILGLPGEGEAEVRETIRQIEELHPDDLTVHSLAIKRASAMGEWIEKNGIELIHNTADMMKIAADGAERMGLTPYYLYRQKNMSGNFENTGYASADKAGLYNILIMEEVQTIVACGAGTVTKRVYDDGRIERCDTVKDVAQYIARIDEMIERKRKLLSD